MRRLLVLAFTVLAVPVMVVAASPAQACSCVQSGVERQLHWADVAFEGTVEEIRPLDHQQVLRIQVARVYEGEVPQRVDLTTGRGGGDCGLEVPEGREVLVFGSTDDGEITTSICAGSSLRLHRAHPALQDWSEPGAGVLVSDDWDDAAPDRPGPGWWIAGGVLLAGGAAYAVRRRRSSDRAETV